MNPETEAILKAMGFVVGDSEPLSNDGKLTFFVPRTHFHLCVYPTATPASLMAAIWEAGGEARKKEINQAREAYLSTLA